MASYRDRNVHQEDRAPPEVFEQPAAADRSDGHPDTDHGRPQPDRLGARYRVGEDIADQSQGGREDHRRADSHGSSRRDQRVGRIHLCRNAGGDREQCEAGAEPAPSAVAVAQAAGRQQQAGHDQGVGIDDPLQLGGVGAQFARQGGERDVDDRGVDADDEDGQADDGEGGNRVIAEDRVSTHE